jgi:N-acetylglutamate synthase-like GNAT family acetyltransferase
MRIRNANAADAEAITAIYADSWNAGFGARMRAIDADSARVERWRHDLSEATPTQWWVAEREGVIVGFVGIGPCRDPVEEGLGELDTIAVAPHAWRSGVGKALMMVALGALRSAGFRAAALWTLRDYPLGEAFYAAAGWRLNGAMRDGGNQIRYDHDLRHQHSDG